MTKAQMLQIQQALIDAAGLLDVIKTEWEPEGCWSEWDAGVRSRITGSLEILAAQADAPAIQPQRIPTREEMASIVYEGAHKSLKNCWKWADDGLDAEHPGRRGYYYKIADAVLDALSLTRPDDPPQGVVVSGEGAISAHAENSQTDEKRCPATRQVFEIVLSALNYDGQDIDSLTVGEIRRALP